MSKSKKKHSRSVMFAKMPSGIMPIIFHFLGLRDAFVLRMILIHYCHRNPRFFTKSSLKALLNSSFKHGLQGHWSIPRNVDRRPYDVINAYLYGPLFHHYKKLPDPVSSCKGGIVQTCTFNPHSNMLFVINDTLFCSVYLFENTKWNKVKSIKLHTSFASAITHAPNAHYVVTGFENGYCGIITYKASHITKRPTSYHHTILRPLHLGANQIIQNQPNEDNSPILYIGHSIKRAMFITAQGHFVRLWQHDTERKIWLIAQSIFVFNNNRIAACDLNPNDRELVMGSCFGALVIWNNQTQPAHGNPDIVRNNIQTIQEENDDKKVTKIAHHPKGAIFATGLFNGNIVVWGRDDVQWAPRQVVAFQTPGYISDISWSPLGNFFFTSKGCALTFDSNQNLWVKRPFVTEALANTASPNTPDRSVSTVEISPNGQFLAIRELKGGLVTFFNPNTLAASDKTGAAIDAERKKGELLLENNLQDLSLILSLVLSYGICRILDAQIMTTDDQYNPLPHTQVPIFNYGYLNLISLCLLVVFTIGSNYLLDTACNKNTRNKRREEAVSPAIHY